MKPSALLAGLTGLLLAGGLRAQEPALVFIAAANHTMPFSELREDQLSAGILKDLGEAIAERLGRSARFVVVPAKRVSRLLDSGGADALCYTTRFWIDAQAVHWSPPLFDYTGVVARGPQAEPRAQLSQLAGEPLGTVAGYVYPEVEAALGAQFRRDDAPDMSRNLAKLAAGRVRYALTEQLTLAYAMRKAPQQGLAPMLTTVSYPTACAFSTRRGLPLARIDRVMAELVKDGSIERILARYR
ncbi:MAG: substrate-binding periplasmic protein [Roseateles sp.]